MCPQTCASLEFCLGGTQAFQQPAERGVMHEAAWNQCEAGRGERCASPTQTFFRAQNFKELNQEHLKSALHSAGPLG